MLGLTVHGAPCKHAVMPSARLFLLLHPQVKAILSAVRSKPRPARCVMVSATMTKAVKRLMGESVAATTAATSSVVLLLLLLTLPPLPTLLPTLPRPASTRFRRCRRQHLQAWGASFLHMWTA